MRMAKLAMMTGCAVLAGCGAATSSHTNSAAPASGAKTVSTSSTTTTTTHRPPRPKPDPGKLPQTPARPSADTDQFHAEMRDLWRGIKTGSVRPAMPAFFPESAYAQVKTLGDPRGDWTIRLVLDYRLDIGDAHSLLGGGAPSAQLVDVQVPSEYAHWVDPGACYNDIGYWEVPNARIVYREGGEVHSLGIASMISWRGVWYVVHLGATYRVGNIGVLDDPEVGPGSSAPSSTC